MSCFTLARSSHSGEVELPKLTSYNSAERLGGTMTHLALAWTVRDPLISNCILGATKVEQLEDNLKALDIMDKLAPDVLQEIEDILQNKPEGAK